MTTPARLAAVGAVATALVATAAGTASAAPAHPDRPDRPGVVVDNQWQLRNALSGGPVTSTFRYGPGGWKVPLTGDWDGNGTRTPGVARPVDGTWVWQLRNTAGAGPASITPFAYGTPTFDIPVVGDWDGDGRDTVGVVRRTSYDAPPRWLLRNANTAGAAFHDFRTGSPNADYVVGDWDGDGTDTPGQVVRTDRTRRWELRDRNSAGPLQRFEYGGKNGWPVVGDWDGDGRDGIGVLNVEAGA